MIELDGSLFSGSGTILRCAAALATVLREPLHIYRIRARRDKPGLRHQHRQAVRACAAMCGGRVQGDDIGSQEIFYYPGKELKGGAFNFDIGTAGSATMLAFTLIQPALYAAGISRFTITGGLFQDFAPTAFHMERILIPLIRKMGGDLELRIDRPGYVPKGGGQISLMVKPLRRALRAIRLPLQGKVEKITGLSLSSHLEQGRVGERMAGRARDLLSRSGYSVEMEILSDNTAPQPGAAFFLAAETSTGCLLGADQAGRRGRRSESIAEFCVNSLLEDLRSGATVDRHMADQLILFAAAADGESEFRIPLWTDHVETGLWLVKEILGAETALRDGYLIIKGVPLTA
ncbi:MAG: RNA 3'-terminal phosphate cyclase [Syntrophales bacterium]